MKNQRPLSTPSGVYESSLDSLEESLLREEKLLAAAFVRRTKLLEKCTVRRHSGRKPGADPDLEKFLWKVWEGVLNREGLGSRKLWRTFLAQCNSLAYALADQDSFMNHEAWTLRPVAANKPVRLHGPADVFTSKILTFWAALSNTQTSLRRPALNDGLIELIKALNQAGAGLSWDNETVFHRAAPGRSLDWAQKSIHVGQHGCTLALVLAMVVGRPGIAKLSGSGALNMYNLKPWQSLCTQLGARLHQLNPHAPGLPVRLESSGQARLVQVDQETPDELTIALAAAAPFYPEGLRLTWPQTYSPGHDLRQLLHLLRSCAVPVAALDNGLDIPAATPRIPSEPEIALDPALCSLLLAWARFGNQPIMVLGNWPKDLPGVQDYLDLLQACGVQVAIDHGSITAKPGKWPSHPVLDIRNLSRALPLAAALALSAPGESTIFSENPIQGLDIMGGLLRFTGRTCESDGLRHHFSRTTPTGCDVSEPEVLKLEAPNAAWGMALAMLSFVHPGLPLANPGELTTLWPHFWNVFHKVLSVPKPKPEHTPQKTDDVQPKKQRRRVRL
jgi:5-enolpyruvylshikimate-3-phosphate synthase